jgi:CO dehydrogenase nickel-insertion accessory protein CooC1
MRDGLVEVPENALVEERIALGLTAPQLGIVAGAVLFGAALNLLPLWAPLKVLLILLLSGPLALAAVLPIRGEPAYRWLLRALRHWRSRRVWRAEVQLASKQPVSGDVIDGDDDDKGGARDGEPRAVRGGTTLTPAQCGAVESGADNQDAATSSLAAPFPPSLAAVTESSVLEEQGAMDGSSPRLRLIGPPQTEATADVAARRDEPERPPAIPFVLPGPRLACFLSFAGGVGKTTLAVETSTLIASQARYRSADGEAHRLRVLVVDAARLSSSVGLRLGIDPDALSRARTHRDWTKAESVAQTIVASSQRLDLISLPPHPILVGRGGADGGAPLQFGPAAAEALLTTAHRAGYQLVVVDLGNMLEEGHQHLLDRADVVIGVVRPTLESIPDVLRLAEHLRGAGWGRKLLLVANQCDDDTELRSFARDDDVPLIGVIPPAPAFSAAADRHQPAWAADLRLRDALLPVARAVWPLDTLGRRHPGRAPILRRWLARLRGTAASRGR